MAVNVSVAAALVVFATVGFGEALLLVLAVGVLAAGYLARRYLRDALLCRDPRIARAHGSRGARGEDE